MKLAHKPKKEKWGGEGCLKERGRSGEGMGRGKEGRIKTKGESPKETTTEKKKQQTTEKKKQGN